MTTPAFRSAVTIAGLSKSFGDKVVLDGIDLDNSPGTIFSLLWSKWRREDDNSGDPLDAPQCGRR